MDEQPLIVVVGPTASGKSGLAVQIAGQLDQQGEGAEIISADSMQLYRGMDIGTAKVTADQQQGIPHHLLDILDVTEEASVADYQVRARQAIAQIRSRGRTPILVGGSGLYVRAVIDVIEFPPTDPQTRGEVEELLKTSGAAELRRQLHQADPESAAVINDERRLIRALEVVRLTGRTFSSYMPQRIHQPTMEPVIQLGVDIQRSLLHQRIATRVHHMADQGLLDEVSALASQGLRQGRTASRAIGYQQYLQVLDGASTEQQAIEDTIVATRKFARRQHTWFRADPRITWLQAPSQNLLDEAMEVIGAQTG